MRFGAVLYGVINLRVREENPLWSRKLSDLRQMYLLDRVRDPHTLTILSSRIEILSSVRSEELVEI